MIRTDESVLDSDLDADFDAEPLPVISGYTTISRIGAGGQAVVYMAECDATSRLVAVKVFDDDSGYTASRLQREAEFLGRIRHPAVVSIHTAGSLGKKSFIVTDFVEGLSIDNHVDLNAVDVPAVVQLVITAAGAVSEAHRCGVLHRDIKPGNILVTEAGDPYVVDFGLAVDDDAEADTASGSIVGTADYCPPERLRGDRADARSDVYGLGMVLYECLADDLPYDTVGDRFTRASRIVFGVPRSLRKAARGRETTNPSISAGSISRDLEAVVMTAMAHDRDARYPTVDAFVDDLRRYLCGDPVLARMRQRGYLVRRIARRHRAFLATAAAMVLTLLVAFAWVSYAWRRAERVVVQTQVAMDMAAQQYSGDRARGEGSRDTAIGIYVASLKLADNLGRDSQRLQLQRYNGHYRLAELYFDENHIDKARHHAHAAIALAPQLIDGRADQTQAASMFLLLGKLAMRDEEYVDAEALFLQSANAFRSMTAVHPWDVPYALARAGTAAEKVGDPSRAYGHYREAIEVYSAALAEHPNHPEILLNLCNTWNRVVAWHLRRRTVGSDRAALTLAERALAALETVDDEALRRDCEKLRHALETNREFAVRRLQTKRTG